MTTPNFRTNYSCSYCFNSPTYQDDPRCAWVANTSKLPAVWVYFLRYGSKRYSKLECVHTDPGKNRRGAWYKFPFWMMLFTSDPNPRRDFSIDVRHDLGDLPTKYAKICMRSKSAAKLAETLLGLDLTIPEIVKSVCDKYGN